MAEALSPNPMTVQKQRRPMASQVQSPTSPFFLGSNNDQLERAQARASRAAAIRRKSIVANAHPPRGYPSPCLGKQQILELFQNCIKLASENKINQKNTWDLNLIDHLTEIIKVEEEDDTETNFQKASCTLEAGVKIYSLRVDSVHSEAYKVLGGMNRAGQANEQESMTHNGDLESEQEGCHPKKEVDRKLSPLSTLESSFEALNVKKFDVAFAVDPLYHQTSAQFDEGGAKGLLMNNLGVYGGCRVLFDSEEVPGNCMSSENGKDSSEIIDISFARDSIDQMVLNARVKDQISPTLRKIMDLFDGDNGSPSDSYFPGHEAEESVHSTDDANVDFDGDAAEDCGTWNNDHDEQTGIAEEGANDRDSTFSVHHQENEPFSFHDTEVDDNFEKVDEYLLSSLGFTSKQNAWAGPDHWKYRKAKGSEDKPTTESESVVADKRSRNKKKAEIDIDFTKSVEKEMSDIFAPPKNPKSLLLPSNRQPCNTKLPEDCHYQPEDLVKLFLLPNVKCIGRRRRKVSDESWPQFDDREPSASWQDDNVFSGHYDDGNDHSDVEDSSTLVSQPRQVNKIEVQYDKTSKQVDVQVLKETIWDHLLESQMTSEGAEKSVSFRQMLATFPTECKAAATINDITPHLCFICLLHLANEHGLSIQGCANLNDLTVNLPS